MPKISNFLHRLTSAVSLGDGMFQKFLLAGSYVWLSVSRKMGLKAELPVFIPVRLAFNNRSFTFHLRHQVDFDVLRDVFVQEEYNLPIVDDPKIIFDLGSNVGVTVIYFALKYPKATIHAFEPDPKNIALFKKNTKQFKERTVLHEKAVHWDPNVKEITFYQNPAYHWSSSLFEQGAGLKKIVVSTVTLEEVMDEYRIDEIDIMKFDIEGAEYDLFKSFTRLGNIVWYVGEVHPHVFKKTTESFIELFKGHEVISREGRIVAMHKKS